MRTIIAKSSVQDTIPIPNTNNGRTETQRKTFRKSMSKSMSNRIKLSSLKRRPSMNVDSGFNGTKEEEDERRSRQQNCAIDIDWNQIEHTGLQRGGGSMKNVRSSKKASSENTAKTGSFRRRSAETQVNNPTRQSRGRSWFTKSNPNDKVLPETMSSSDLSHEEIMREARELNLKQPQSSAQEKKSLRLPEFSGGKFISYKSASSKKISQKKRRDSPVRRTSPDRRTTKLMKRLSQATVQTEKERKLSKGNILLANTAVATGRMLHKRNKNKNVPLRKLSKFSSLKREEAYAPDKELLGADNNDAEGLHVLPWIGAHCSLVSLEKSTGPTLVSDSGQKLEQTLLVQDMVEEISTSARVEE